MAIPEQSKHAGPPPATPSDKSMTPNEKFGMWMGLIAALAMCALCWSAFGYYRECLQNPEDSKLHELRAAYLWNILFE